MPHKSRSGGARVSAGDLPAVGCVLVAQTTSGPDVEVPILYTIYQPLKDWGQFRYTQRGELHLHVTFDEESLQNFINQHPMKGRLILRIERHPYGFHCRYRNSIYMKCRAKECSVDAANSFKVGDFRIAVDEVTGRLGVNQFNDNDPYFSACFFHLQCFEKLTCAPDLVGRNSVVIDNRGQHCKEPESTKINKMGVTPAAAAAFGKWCEMAIEKLTEDAHWQPPAGETLAAAMWLSSIRRGRKYSRAPPGITSDRIEQSLTAHPGWGGKRVSGLSVALMNEMELQGRFGEIIASRNGETGKMGVEEPERMARKRSLPQMEGDYEGVSALTDFSLEGYSSGYTSEAERPSSIHYEDAEYLPSKRQIRGSVTPEGSLETTR